MTGHVFTARYDGRCRECGETILEGDQIRHSDEHGGVIHDGCLDRPSTIKPREVCPRCFIEKAVNGECGCA